MFSSLLALFSCSSKFDKTPVFPQTDNQDVKVEKLEIPANQNVVSYIISRDKKQVLVYTFENENDNSPYPTVGSHLLFFDENGKFEKDFLLNINANGAYYDLFFAENGLLTMGNGNYIHFIDTQTFQLKSIRTYRVTDNPFYKKIEQQANDEGRKWQDAEIKKLNIAYGLNDNEIKMGNKKTPTEYWNEYRAIKNETESKIYTNQQNLYSQYVRSLIPQNQTLSGVLKGNIRYVLLKYGDDESLFQVENDVSQKINWLYLKSNNSMSCTDVPNQLNWKNNQIHDAQNTMTCLEKNKTSSYNDDLVGKMKTDYVIELQLGTKKTKFKVKDRPVQLANDEFFALSNGNIIIKHKSTVYIIH